MNEVQHPGFDKSEKYETFTTTNGLKEAAENRVTENGRFKITSFEKMRIEDIMFGAEWMAKQGVYAYCIESSNPVSESPDKKYHSITLTYEENENIPYVRASDRVFIQIRKKEE